MQYRRAKIKGATYFFTVVTCARKRILCRDENVLLIKEAFSRVKEQFPFTMDAFALLPDHIHCIWTLPEGDNDYSKRLRFVKSYFTKRCERMGQQTASRLNKGEQAVWQRRFWEHTIRGEDDFKRHVEYIHYNPVKHGLAKSPMDWPYSSFHQYVKQGIYDKDWGAGSEMVFDDKVGHE